MLKTRIILLVASAVVIWLIFLLPKAVVDNEGTMKPRDSARSARVVTPAQPHTGMPAGLAAQIKSLKAAYLAASSKEKNAIFADSLQNLYGQAGQFDSAALYGAEAASFFNNTKSALKAGNSYYEAYTFAMDAQKQKMLAEKTREWLGKVIDADPKNYDARIKVAMTYMSTGGPMQGIRQLRDILKEDPKNELALFNMGMLAIQSGQNSKAIDWLKQLAEANPRHVQGALLLGVAYQNNGQKQDARAQFEKVKKMDNDPAVQATADSYLKDLK